MSSRHYGITWFAGAESLTRNPVTRTARCGDMNRETPVTSTAISHQLQPLVLPQLGQAWQEPARCI